MVIPQGNPFKCHEDVLYLHPMILPKRFAIFSPDWGMLKRSRRVLFFFIQQHSPKKEAFSWKVGIEPSSTPLLGLQGSRRPSGLVGKLHIC